MTERSLEELKYLARPALNNPELVAKIAVSALGSPVRANTVVLPAIEDEELTKAWRWLLVLARDSEGKYGVSFSEVLSLLLQPGQTQSRQENEEMATTATLDKEQVFRNFVLMATQSSNPRIREHADSIIQGKISQGSSGFPFDIQRIENLVGVPIRFNEGFPYCKPEEASFSLLWKGRQGSMMNQIVELTIHPFFLREGKCTILIKLEVRSSLHSGYPMFKFEDELMSIKCYRHHFATLVFGSHISHYLEIHSNGIKLLYGNLELDLSPPVLTPVK